MIKICIATLLRVNPKPTPVTPNALRIEEALQRSAPLARLAQLMQDSNARFSAIRPCLPAALAPHVKPGPVDETGWSLLAANASVAAKLRQLQPRLEEVLRERGWQVNAVRVKVQSG
ncbi:MAG: DciA family protein [Burkholderiaceae bacterium]